MARSIGTNAPRAERLWRRNPAARPAVTAPALATRRVAHARWLEGVLALTALVGLAGCRPLWLREAPRPQWQVESQTERAPLPDLPPPTAPHGEPDASPAVPARLERLSLEEAVVLALRQNRGLRVQQLEPQIAGTFEIIEQAAFDPVLFARYDVTRDYYRETIPRLEHIFRELGEDVFEVGASRQLPTGTRVGATAATWREDDTPDVGQNVSRLGVSVTQALLRGRDLGANLANVEKARIDLLASEFELRGYAEFLVAEVESTYWDAVLGQAEVAILEDSLEWAQRQLQETDQLIGAGLLPRTERLAAEAEVALREQALIDAANRHDTAQLRLGRLLDSLPADDPSATELVTPPEMAVVPLEAPQEHTTLALVLRPDLNEARARVRQSRLEVVQTRNGLLPQLDLFVTLGKTGYADSFDRSAGNLGREGYDVFAGLHYEFPPANRAARARHEGAELLRDRAVRAVENLEQLVELDVRTAHLEVRRARRQIDASATTLRLQQETLDAEQAKFRAGESTSILVAQAQRDLLGSQLDEIRAVVALRKALVELYRVEGSLLIRRGIAAPGRGVPADLPASPAPPEGWLQASDD